MDEELDPEELTVCYDPEGFRAQAQHELDRDMELYKSAKKPFREGVWMHSIAIALLAVSGAIIILDSKAIYLWLFIGLLLYSYNFITLLNPTTTIKPRPKEKKELREQGLSERMVVFRLLSKKRKLAIEMGLTIFLVGNIPLVLAFSMIFGLALVFLLYFAGVAHTIDWEIVSIVVFQMVLILGFQIFLYAIKPESQGITKLAKTMKGRYDEARSKGLSSLLIFFMVMVGIIVVSALLVIGAMLLPNYTMYTIWAKFMELGQSSLMLTVIVVAVQVFVIRHFEAHESRAMALRLLLRRANRIRKEVLEPLDDLMSRKDTITEEQFEEEFFDIRSAFFSVVIYQVVKIDIFGMSPVYLVGPRLKYILDDKVLNHFHD